MDGQSRDETDNRKPEVPSRPTEQPVSKEERFVEDFDRSWPKSRGTTIMTRDSTRNGPVQGDINISPVSVAPTISSTSSVPSHSRVLFNERSNRMEPYSHKLNGSSTAPSHSNWRSSHQEEHRPDQVVSDHVAQQDVHLLHRESKLSYSSVAATAGNDETGRRNFPTGEKVDLSRGSMDSTSRSSLSHPKHNATTASADELSKAGSSRITDTGTAYRKFDSASSSHSQTVANGRVPRQGWPTRETPAEDIPDKGKSIALTSQRLPPLRPLDGSGNSDEHLHDNSGTDGANIQATEGSSTRDEKQSPLQGNDVADQDSLRKAFLHASAERAKERRRQEEEERQKIAERARQKALELENKMKTLDIADTGKTHDTSAQAAVSVPSVKVKIKRILSISKVFSYIFRLLRFKKSHMLHRNQRHKRSGWLKAIHPKRLDLNDHIQR